jgi:hypothetical protein
MRNRQNRRQIQSEQNRLMKQKPGPWLKIEDVQEKLDLMVAEDSINYDVPTYKSSLLKQVHSGYYNNHYSVLIRTFFSKEPWINGDVDHLWIKRNDNRPVHSWVDIQSIKNKVLWHGESRVGVEVYPRAAELFDQSNWYHLWVLPPDVALPFTLN